MEFSQHSPTTEAQTSINFIASVVSQVRDNHVGFRRTSERLLYLLESIEEGRRIGVVPSVDLDAAMLALLQLIKRAERIVRMELQRSLGDKTWNRSEIRAELDRLTSDIDNYLGSRIIKNLGESMKSEEQSPETAQAKAEDTMVALAYLDLKEDARSSWPNYISTRARVRREALASDNAGHAQVSVAEGRSRNSPAEAKRTVELLASSVGPLTVKIEVRNLWPFNWGGSPASRTVYPWRASLGFDSKAPTGKTMTLEVPRSATLADLYTRIEAAGYAVPDELRAMGECITVKVSEQTTSLDPSAPGGLQIPMSTPLIHYYSKCLRYHGVSAATTTGHTLAKLADDKRGVIVGGVEFRFHRTVRVPDNGPRPANLPPSLGYFPLEPVARFGNRVPDDLRKKGGFIMPMFEREAMWISIKDTGHQKPAVKVSVGGVNAITGVASASPTPPQFTQDYVVAGLQPWLDGVMTDSGIVRQFVAMSHGNGYTVEEQITSKAEQGGLQFDVFPVHDMALSALRKGGGVFNQQSTPSELSLATGDEVQLTIPPAFNALVSSFAPLSSASLPQYLDKAISSVTLIASYVQPMNDVFVSWKTQARDGIFLSVQSHPALHAPPPAPHLPRGPRYATCSASAFRHQALGPPQSSALPSKIGVAPGGRITQRIYPDTRSTRVYDEERGQRFHVHIVNPTEWELITGVVAPIEPISASSYKHPNLPWFVLADSHQTTLSVAGSSLSQLKSVAELDAEKEAECADEIDPDHPPSCSKHPRIASVCVFRPCSHTACSTCLGAVMMLRMKCLACETKVDRIVGMKDAVVVPSQVEEGDGLEWDVSQMEELASLAADSNNVSIIHLEEDRVSPLHKSGPLRPTAVGRLGN